jgi:hypothetical protein
LLNQKSPLFQFKPKDQSEARPSLGTFAEKRLFSMLPVIFFISVVAIHDSTYCRTYFLQVKQISKYEIKVRRMHDLVTQWSFYKINL